MTAHFVTLLDQLKRRSLRMASVVEDMLHESIEAILGSDDALARQVIGRDHEVNTAEVEVEAEAIRLMALYQPVGADLRFLCTVLKTNNDLERIADCAVNIAERARHFEAQAAGAQRAYVQEMGPLVCRILRAAIHAYGSQEAVSADAVFADEELVDALYVQTMRSIVTDAAKHPADMASYLDIHSVAKNLERIADHATNIAEDAVFLTTGEIVRHRGGQYRR